MVIRRIFNRAATLLPRAILATALFVGSALAIPATLLLMPQSAFAEPMAKPDTTPQYNEQQQRVINTATVYNDALSRLTNARQRIDTSLTQLEEIGEQVVVQREKSARAIREYYRMLCSSNGMLEVLFSAQTFSELTARYEYIIRLHGSYSNEVARLTALGELLSNARESLELAQGDAQTEAIRAEEALADALAARVAVMPSFADFADREAFIEHWAPRIDAYMESYPLAGYGRDFAAAAWDYGVDPRLAPAISCNESGKGRECFRAHNAWGWGNIDWPDWPTAIDEYTAGLSRGYGYTIGLEAAQRYVGTDQYPEWHEKLTVEMSLI